MASDPLDGAEIFIIPNVGECVIEMRNGLPWTVELKNIDYIGRKLHCRPGVVNEQCYLECRSDNQ